jgi:hypothetical protein
LGKFAIPKVEDREVRVVGNHFDLLEAVFKRWKKGVAVYLALDER